MLGLLGSLLLITLAMAVPALTGWQVHVRTFPPLHADWAPRLGPGTVPAVLLAVLAVWRAGTIARMLPWPWLLLSVFAAGLAWMLALATVDGRDGVGVILTTPYEYLQTARSTTDVHQTLQEYVARIPFSAEDNWPPHLAGHPPGALLFFVALVRLGLGGGFAAGLVVTLVAASTGVAVLVTLRLLDAEVLARRAAPFLVFGPAAIWQCVSADGMFAAVGAWGVAAVALAAKRRSVPWAVVAGLLLGYTVMLSYGLPLLAILVLTVMLLLRNLRPLPVVVGAGLAVVGVFALLGFNYLEALSVLHDRYWAGVARNRPAAYWLWGNLAALTFSAGPALGAGLVHQFSSFKSHRSRPAAVVVALSGAAVLMVALADLSLMSKAEVERIWLPFVPWLLLSCALLPARWARPLLGIQVVAALVVQHLLFTGW